jgi:hypothetical protein
MGHSWRTVADIRPNWGSIMEEVCGDAQSPRPDTHESRIPHRRSDCPATCPVVLHTCCVGVLTWRVSIGQVDVNQRRWRHAGPGRGFNDPDMLEVGNAQVRDTRRLWCTGPALTEAWGYG